MRTRKRIEAVGGSFKDTKTIKEPTSEELEEFIAKRKKGEFSGKIDTFVPIEQAGVNKPKIPSLPEEEPMKKFVMSKMTDEELEMFTARNEWIRDQRRKASTEKLLKEISQNKYSSLIGKKVNIRGELYEVKPIDRKSKDNQSTGNTASK
jgi:hypothetical protein